MAADDRLPLAQRLDLLTSKALAKLEEIINEPNGPGYADHGPLARIQADAAKTILGAQMRADESALRDRQEADTVRQLLEAVLARKAHLAALEEPDDE
jgi:hypothetical protein